MEIYMLQCLDSSLPYSEGMWVEVSWKTKEFLHYLLFTAHRKVDDRNICSRLWFCTFISVPILAFFFMIKE